ncbi:hypothetical protein [Streptantibioticus cattleyicolor]|uniref:Uncharacterized protein n=1 Tax=Streptantibioticus cattleyicolor (strain ATCC 35852 / DSM 46488 / JCM 4925 / NBRC 14057 / NRRL 8057) TaxID=1003195 RepID=F8JIU7_STREN|nr:hypothetical protein [Streptantibioticus cattleyicolor]AEW98971.1 hypothetical protein SCATT_p07780 [Streptantibioticus cattleyicolor NRRL 8057 = DSM 46488]CCB71986.1 conserved protein of unknown function [Streptantibioticus cattleyicolor NRRL 8057 = DSM 46488]
MAGEDGTGWETAVLHGGPADGLRVKVVGRPPVIEVTQPRPVEAAGTAGRTTYLYRRAPGADTGPVRYGYDAADAP